ncbi:MAG: sulfatase-like hydrolase/transferase [Candidatus Marinimicrobia bacterium]|nr:sulfatase-like hydrolase/transferase [Candidatus Neomarinimicrobiota bacterium]
MINIVNISRRLKYLFGITILFWSLFIVLRFSFFFVFYEPSSLIDILKSFWIGTRFDLRLSIFLSLPCLIITIAPIVKYWRFSYTVFAANWTYSLVLISAIFFYIFDFATYGYTQQRIDITVFTLLENFTISLGMIWESYPVIRLLLLVLIICALFIKIHNWLIGVTLKKKKGFQTKYQKAFQLIFCFFIYIFGFWGTLSQYMLLWSDAFFSRSAFISALALNPILYFYDTTTFQEADFEIDKVEESYPIISNYLGTNNPDINNLNYVREIEPSMKMSNHPNVVIIFMESVGLNRLGIAGNPLNATPFLDSLSSNGLYFSKFYIPWVSTSRSVFTMLTGIPDVARRTSSRNPIIRDQYSIISEFEDYDKYYMIGGSASWANIRSLVSYNIKEMKLIEMADINRPRVDVWGVSDLDLFKEADNILKNKQDLSKPSFMIIQTAGNHRPYTIPDDNDGFITKSIKKESLTKAGFKSIEQFNAMRLLDHSIGKFFDLAEESSYYENTIFVLFGDHGTADPQAKHMGLEDYELKLRSYNVPLIIFSPKIIQNPQIINRASGLSDLMPTIAGLCKIPYMNKTIGRDLLISDNNLAFLVNKKMNPTSYGVIDDQFYLRVFRDGSGYELHNILDKDPIKNVRSIFSNEADSLKKIADAIYHTSKYMLYHNNN